MSTILDGGSLDGQGRIFRLSGNLLLIRDVFRTCPHRYEQCGRGAISGFSEGAGRRMRRYLRGCAAEYRAMVTLTYPHAFPLDGRTCKDHLRRFIQELRRWAGRNGTFSVRWSCFWFLEFQERGAPHFHLFCTDFVPKEYVAAVWYRIVGSEDERHFRAGTRIEELRSGRAGTVSYATKYAAKAEQKVVPEGFENVGRFWGVSGCRRVDEASCYVPERIAADVSRETSRVLSVTSYFCGDSRAKVIKTMPGFRLVAINDPFALDTIRGAMVELCLGVSEKYRWKHATAELFTDADIDLDE